MREGPKLPSEERLGEQARGDADRKIESRVKVGQITIDSKILAEREKKDEQQRSPEIDARVFLEGIAADFRSIPRRRLEGAVGRLALGIARAQLGLVESAVSESRQEGVVKEGMRFFERIVFAVEKLAMLIARLLLSREDRERFDYIETFLTRRFLEKRNS